MEGLKEKNAVVVHDKELNCLYVHLSGFIPYDNLIKALEYEFKMIRHYMLKKCIVDIREIKVYPAGGAEYIKDVWFPQIEKDGVKLVAFIVPASVFGEVSMKAAHDKVEKQNKVQIKNFQDLDSARHWIRELKEA